MAKRVENPKRARRNPWVPAGIDAGHVHKPAGESGNADEWLPVHKAESNGRNGHSLSNGGGNDVRATWPDVAAERTPSRGPRKRHRLPKRASPRERWLIVRLRRARRRLDEQADELDRLNRRVAELEAVVAEHREPPKRTSPKPPSKPKRVTRTTAAKRARPNGNDTGRQKNGRVRVAAR